MMELDVRSFDGVEVVALRGRFDVETAPAVRAQLDILTGQESARLVVNLQDVDFLDSTGLATLVRGQKRAQEANGGLKICGLQQPVRIIFELTRLDTFFELHTTESEAVASFGFADIGQQA